MIQQAFIDMENMFELLAEDAEVCPLDVLVADFLSKLLS